jgi:hypothetical protein
LNLRQGSGALAIAFILALSIMASAHTATSYAPKATDSFSYQENMVVNNGQGSYLGYTDQTTVTGKEMVTSTNGSNVLSHYDYTYSYSNNQGNSSSSSSSGDFTWSSRSFQYINGTDNQVGYSKPIYVWFAMNSSLPVGATFYSLNTQMTVQSKNYSFQLPGNGGRWVQTIQAEGTGQYQRQDSYGTFAASYTWDEYFDSTTGYIVGYSYVEQDNGQYQGQSGSFTYTDSLYLTSSSYTLTPGSPSVITTTPTVNITTQTAAGPLSDLGTDAVLAGALIVAFILIAVVAYATTRRRKGGQLPQHPPPPVTPPPSTPWQPGIDLGSKPPQEVVIRDVAKVNCRYCGTLIPTTADTCPYCGGPRR